MLKSRSDLIDRFLDTAGWAGAERHPLPADASFRQYVRLNNNGRAAMLMDAPPPEDVSPFVSIARHLHSLNLSAPAILAEDHENGLLLLEDFGDATYTRLLKDGADEVSLYELAIDVLIHLHQHGDAVPADLPAYNNAVLHREANLLTEWTLPAFTDAPIDQAGYTAAWERVFSAAHSQPQTLVLRDYHVDNLMRLDDRDGVSACGLLDFQDALHGATAYDVVSLLEDARRDIAPDLIDAMLVRYLTAFPDLDIAAFKAAYAILGAQRHAKVIGIFTRLNVRDGKDVYLSHIPRVWRLLERNLNHPALAPVKVWFDAHVPPHNRIIPPLSEAAQ